MHTQHPGVFPPTESPDLHFHRKKTQHGHRDHPGEISPPEDGPRDLRAQAQIEGYVVFDLETRKAAHDVGGWGHTDRMGISVAITWNKAENNFRTFFQDDAEKLSTYLQAAPLVVGFNHVGFDYKVLEGITGKDIRGLTHNLDILDYAHQTLGHRIKLEQIATATLGSPKSADGLQAIRWWNVGEIDKIAEYCKQDVALTRDLYEYGLNNKQLFFDDKYGRRRHFFVDWSSTQFK